MLKWAAPRCLSPLPSNLREMYAAGSHVLDNFDVNGHCRAGPLGVSAEEPRYGAGPVEGLIENVAVYVDVNKERLGLPA